LLKPLEVINKEKATVELDKIDENQLSVENMRVHIFYVNSQY